MRGTLPAPLPSESHAVGVSLCSPSPPWGREDGKGERGAGGSEPGVSPQVGGVPVPRLPGLPVRAGAGQAERRVQEVQRIQQPGPHQPDPVHPPHPALSRGRARAPRGPPGCRAIDLYLVANKGICQKKKNNNATGVPASALLLGGCGTPPPVGQEAGCLPQPCHPPAPSRPGCSFPFPCQDRARGHLCPPPGSPGPHARGAEGVQNGSYPSDALAGEMGAYWPYWNWGGGDLGGRGPCCSQALCRGR